MDFVKKRLKSQFHEIYTDLVRKMEDQLERTKESFLKINPDVYCEVVITNYSPEAQDQKGRVIKQIGESFNFRIYFYDSVTDKIIFGYQDKKYISDDHLAKQFLQNPRLDYEIELILSTCFYMFLYHLSKNDKTTRK